MAERREEAGSRDWDVRIEEVPTALANLRRLQGSRERSQNIASTAVGEQRAVARADEWTPSPEPAARVSPVRRLVGVEGLEPPTSSL